MTIAMILLGIAGLVMSVGALALAWWYADRGEWKS